MKPFAIVISTVGVLAILVPAPVSAQQTDLKAFTAEVGSLLRFRQFSDATTLGRGGVELGVQLTPADEAKPSWGGLSLDQTDALPGVVARVGVSNRVDIGAWGQVNNRSNYAVAGIDSKILLLKEGPGRPVSVAIRPSVGALIGPSEVWAAHASIDLSASRTFGRVSPYVGVATTGSLAVERSPNLDLDPATADGSLAYAGLTYRWRALTIAAEAEKGDAVRYGVRIGTRF